MKLLDRFKKLKTLYKILIIVAIIVVGVGGWVAYDNRPRPLGDEMVYLGKEDYGNIFGFDARPTSVYYYGTDMDETSMKEYFTATYSPLEGLAFKNARFAADNKAFKFVYKEAKQHPTTKKYVVSIVDEDYEIARKYLRR